MPDPDPIDAALGASTRARSVMDGNWVQASVSQLKDASLCMLKWYYGKVLRYPKKRPSKGLQIGLDGHAELEHYLLTGQRALGRWSGAGMPYLPAPGPGILVEHRFDGQKKGAPFNPATALLRAGGVPLDGYIDVVNGRLLAAGGEIWAGGPRAAPRTLVMVDHKFSKNIEPIDSGGYAALPEHLADTDHEHGIQMIGYDEWARLMLAAGKLPAFDQIVNVHLYYVNGTGNEKTPRCRPVWTTVDLAHVEKEWFKVNQLAARVVDSAKETDLLKVDFNENACGEYGGCDFANVCPRSTLNRYMNDPGKEADPMSLLDEMLGPVPANTFPPPPPPAPAFTPSAVPPMVAQFPQGVAVQVPTTAPPPAPVAPPTGWVQAGAALQGQTYFIQSAGRPATFTCLTSGLASFSVGPNTMPLLLQPTEMVFPIDAPPLPVTAPAGSAVVGIGSDARPIPAVLPVDAPPSNPLTSSEPTKVAPVAPTAAVAAPTEEKAKRKRRTKEEMAADEAAAAAASSQSTETPVGAGNTPGGSVPAPASDPGFAGIRLYIGCRPDAGSTRLDDYIRDLVGKLCSRYNVKDPRNTPRLGTGAKDKDHSLAFDGWKGILASVVAIAPPNPGSYHFQGQSDFADVIVPALIALLPPENVVRAG